MTMLRDTWENHLRYADLLQGNVRRIRACRFRWTKNGGEAVELEQEVHTAFFAAVHTKNRL